MASYRGTLTKGEPLLLRMSLPWILEVMASIDSLTSLRAGMRKKDALWQCTDVKQRLQTLFDQSIYASYLKISRERAAALRGALDGIYNNTDGEGDQLSTFDEWHIRRNRDDFRNVFFAELSVLPSFLVMGKESYDTNTLIDGGYKLFPPATLQKCPEAAIDMSEAGKALAFELATACGFHVFRVTEAVLKRYWDHVSDGKERPKLETIGSYVLELEKKKLGDEKIREALKQLASLHRNPIIHPQVILTVEEAIGTLGIARSVIGAMLREMPDVSLDIDATEH